MSEFQPIKLHEVCDRVSADYDEARYALARKVLPADLDVDHGRGNHRLFNWPQALHLAMALRLKMAQINLTLIRDVVAWAWNWEPHLPSQPPRPAKHRPHQKWRTWAQKRDMISEAPWRLEIGDAQFARWVYLNHSSKWDRFVDRPRANLLYDQPRVWVCVDLLFLAQSLDR